MNTFPQIHAALVLQFNDQETRNDASTSVGAAEHTLQPTPAGRQANGAGRSGCERQRMTITPRRRA
jgi:hypothetical protein